MPLAHTVHELPLKNGAKGLLIHVPGATATTFSVVFRAGNDYVADKTRHQTAHLMEHMAFGANEKFSSQQEFSQELTKNGASFEATTWDTNMAYGVSAAVMEWRRIVSLLDLAITRPKYTQEVLDSEKGNVREELEGNESDHIRVLWQQLYRHMGDTSFIDSEKIETIDNVTLQDLQQHFLKTHTMRNMRVIVAGDLLEYSQEIAASIDSWPLQTGSRLPIELSSVRKTDSPLSLYRSELTSINFSISITLDRILTREEENAMDALNYILTGSFHSRIFGKARTQGICYDMDSNTATDADGMSTWEIYGQVRQENATRLFDLIVQELTVATTRGIDQKELDEAAQYATGRFQLRAQTVDALAGEYAEGFFEYDEIRSLEHNLQLIHDTQRETMVRVAREFIDNSTWSLGTIGAMQQPQTQALYEQFSQLFSSEVK